MPSLPQKGAVMEVGAQVHWSSVACCQSLLSAWCVGGALTACTFHFLPSHRRPHPALRPLQGVDAAWCSWAAAGTTPSPHVSLTPSLS